MRCPIRLLFACAFLLAVVVDSTAADSSYNDRVTAVRKALKSDDVKQRARAFDPMRESDDPRAVEFLISGVDGVIQEQEAIRAAQVAAEKAYEGAVNSQESNRKRFESSGKSSRDVDKYNAEERRISKMIDESLRKLRDLENDFLRTRAQVDNAVQAMAQVVSRLAPADLEVALVTLEKGWLRSPSRPEAAFWWLDSIVSLDRPWVAGKVHASAIDPTLPMAFRGAAGVSLADRKDPRATEVLIPFLAGKPEEYVLLAAAVEGLRSLHVRDAIPALIDFLKREDVKGLRDAARDALRSLTGQSHGPYHDPWHRWWEEAKSTFEMPPKPVIIPRGEEKGGVTFYGIHIFSDRILFILDVSGSMDLAMKKEGGGGGETRIAVAKRELTAAVNSLDNGARFNLILFNHQVIPWQSRISIASDTTRRQATRWAQEVPPVGGTNIHDALEAGFQLAQRVTGVPDIDTIMFMTDGKPTAGKIQDSAAILDAVREWNRSARLTIHCVGVGECDEKFLQDLAEIGHGQFVKR